MLPTTPVPLPFNPGYSLIRMQTCLNNPYAGGSSQHFQSRFSEFRPVYSIVPVPSHLNNPYADSASRFQSAFSDMANSVRHPLTNTIPQATPMSFHPGYSLIPVQTHLNHPCADSASQFQSSFPDLANSVRSDGSTSEVELTTVTSSSSVGSAKMVDNVTVCIATSTGSPVVTYDSNSLLVPESKSSNLDLENSVCLQNNDLTNKVALSALTSSKMDSVAEWTSTVVTCASDSLSTSEPKLSTVQFLSEAGVTAETTASVKTCSSADIKFSLTENFAATNVTEIRTEMALCPATLSLSVSSPTQLSSNISTLKNIGDDVRIVSSTSTTDSCRNSRNIVSTSVSVSKVEEDSVPCDSSSLSPVGFKPILYVEQSNSEVQVANCQTESTVAVGRAQATGVTEFKICNSSEISGSCPASVEVLAPSHTSIVKESWNHPESIATTSLVTSVTTEAKQVTRKVAVAPFKSLNPVHISLMKLATSSSTEVPEVCKGMKLSNVRAVPSGKTDDRNVRYGPAGVTVSLRPPSSTTARHVPQSDDSENRKAVTTGEEKSNRVDTKDECRTVRRYPPRGKSKADKLLNGTYRADNNVNSAEARSPPHSSAFQRLVTFAPDENVPLTRSQRRGRNKAMRRLAGTSNTINDGLAEVAENIDYSSLTFQQLLTLHCQNRKAATIGEENRNRRDTKGECSGKRKAAKQWNGTSSASNNVNSLVACSPPNLSVPQPVIVPATDTNLPVQSKPLNKGQRQRRNRAMRRLAGTSNTVNNGHAKAAGNVNRSSPSFQRSLTLQSSTVASNSKSAKSRCGMRRDTMNASEQSSGISSKLTPSARSQFPTQVQVSSTEVASMICGKKALSPVTLSSSVSSPTQLSSSVSAVKNSDDDDKRIVSSTSTISVATANCGKSRNIVTTSGSVCKVEQGSVACDSASVSPVEFKPVMYLDEAEQASEMQVTVVHTQSTVTATGVHYSVDCKPCEDSITCIVSDANNNYVPVNDAAVSEAATATASAKDVTDSKSHPSPTVPVSDETCRASISTVKTNEMAVRQPAAVTSSPTARCHTVSVLPRAPRIASAVKVQWAQMVSSALGDSTSRPPMSSSSVRRTSEIPVSSNGKSSTVSQQNSSSSAIPSGDGFHHQINLTSTTRADKQEVAAFPRIAGLSRQDRKRNYGQTGRSVSDAVVVDNEDVIIIDDEDIIVIDEWPSRETNVTDADSEAKHLACQASSSGSNQCKISYSFVSIVALLPLPRRV